MISSFIFIGATLCFVNVGLVHLAVKYKEVDMAVFKVAIIALVFIDTFSLIAIIHVLFNYLRNK